MKIEDGTGKGFETKVDCLNRLHTHAFNVPLSSFATTRGDAFNISSGLVTLTSACESGLLYIKNNECDDIAVLTEFVDIGTSVNACCAVVTLDGVIRFHLNSTTGTLISVASCACVDNRKIGNPTTLTADTFKGVEGSTLTNGSEVPIPTSTSTRNVIPSEWIIPKGATFAVSYEPPTGNASVDIQVGFFVVKNYSMYGTD